MMSRSDPSLLGNPPEQPPVSVFNQTAPLMPHVQLVQAFPVFPHGVPGVPVVLQNLQQARMPMTLIQPPPPPLPVNHLPPTTKVVVAGNQPVIQSSYVTTGYVQSSSNMATTNDALQRFVERAEKSGIKLAALPETNVPAEKQAGVGRTCSVDTLQSSQSAGTAVSSASVNRLTLNITSPEFVPRGQMAAAADVSVPHYSSESCVLGLGRAIDSLNSGVGVMDNPNAFSAGDMSTYSRRSVGVHNNEYSYRNCDIAEVSYLPQHFASISVGESPQPPGTSYNARRRYRDAFTQTVSVKLVNACTGSTTSSLLVDASTNTPCYDEDSGWQQMRVKAESKVDKYTDSGIGLNASHDESFALSSSVGHTMRSQSTVVGSQASRWADCWHRERRPVSVKSDEKSAFLFRGANENHMPSAMNFADSNASRFESSSLSFDHVYDAVVLSEHEVHGSCDCMISNCPFASTTLPLSANRNVMNEHGTDVSGNSNSFGTSPEPDVVLQKSSPKQSSEYETLPDEDLSAEVYYSDEDTGNLLLPTGDTASNTASHAEYSSNPQPTTVHQDHAALLSQLTTGDFPSPATIELAVAQLMDALTGEEKQQMTQLVQQMAVMNPVLAAASPKALQVEAIRIILTTRGQMALLLSQPAAQQLALQAQLQNLAHSDDLPGAAAAAAAESTSVIAQAESCPVATAAVNHHQDMASQPRHPRVSKSPRKCDDSVTLATDRKYPEECSSVSSDHFRLEAGLRPARGRGRGRSLSCFQDDDEVYHQDQPRGRGSRRLKAGTFAADESTNALQSGNSSAAARHPLVPPPLHTAQPVSHSTNLRGAAAANSSEDWEEEIDEFGPGTFNVESSFFKSGKR